MPANFSIYESLFDAGPVNMLELGRVKRIRLDRVVSFSASVVPRNFWRAALWIAVSFFAGRAFVSAQSDQQPASAVASDALNELFAKHVQPFLQEHCLHCHNADEMTAGVNLSRLTDDFPDPQLFLWRELLKQIAEGHMPPEDEPELEPGKRMQLVDAIGQCMNLARARNKSKHGLVRRMTVTEYRNTLESLLGIQEDLTAILPPDGISKDGFTNNAATLGFSPLQIEYYFDIAERALDICIVDESRLPTIQKFRADFGSGINPAPCQEELILGANSELLPSEDFIVLELTADKSFEFQPFFMQKSFRFIEGYQGNDTVRGWRDFEGIQHAVFACMRGSQDYPLGLAYESIPAGLLLRPAIPSSEVWGNSSTYGPHANFKISLRELPDHGNFRITVVARREPDALLLDIKEPVAQFANPQVVSFADEGASGVVEIHSDGIYQVNVVFAPATTDKTDDERENPKKTRKETHDVGLQLGQYFVTRQVADEELSSHARQAWMVLRLKAGKHQLRFGLDEQTEVKKIEVCCVDEAAELAERFRRFERTPPILGVHLGLRRDCGSTLKPVGPPRIVSSDQWEEYTFEGAIDNYPRPFTEANNVNYLAGVREIGVRHEYTDGRETPRLLISSIDFEGPYYETWPPAKHQRIFIDSPNRERPQRYATEILKEFMRRAYRRPVEEEELKAILDVWQAAQLDGASFEQSIKDALLVVLTSPQFLLLTEESHSPESEPLDAYELASKLSYFLWNGPPDESLLLEAENNTLHNHLPRQLDRLMRDEKFKGFVRQFGSEWLSLDKLDVVEPDLGLYPRLTNAAKSQLREEPIQFLAHLFSNNLSVRNVVHSDFVVVNETVASYYELTQRVDSRFEFIPVKHGSLQLGGVLSQASILAGLSDGREANPVKRGAWFARKIIADPPDPPPPNVPELGEIDENLPLRERLRLHRDQPGCAKCHAGIDPWGIPFESYDAAGRWTGEDLDTRSVLPDGTEVSNLSELRNYLLERQLERVAFSFLKHLAVFAAGRDLSYNELMWLEEQLPTLKSSDYRVADMLRLVATSEMFLTK